MIFRVKRERIARRCMKKEPTIYVTCFHKYCALLGEMTKAIKENKELNDVGWDNSAVFVDETEVSEYFGYCVFLTVQKY